MRRLPFVFVALMMILMTPRPVAAATITFDARIPASPVVAYEPLSHMFVATGDTTIEFSTVSGAVPTGTTLAPTGLLSGTPTAVGTFAFTLRATGSPSAAFADKAFTIVVQAPTITLDVNLPPSTFIGQFSAYPFYAAGGQDPHTFRVVSGTLPPGMSLSPSGTFSGTPAALGTYAFAIVVSDTHGFESSPHSLTFDIVIAAAKFTSPTPPSGKVGVAYHSYFAANGDSLITFAVVGGVLPPGLTLTSTGDLSGTPTTAGTYTFTVKATGTASSTTLEVTIVIASSGPTLPITGNNVALIGLVGLGALVAGALLILLTRRRRPLAAVDAGRPAPARFATR